MRGEHVVSLTVVPFDLGHESERLEVSIIGNLVNVHVVADKKLVTAAHFKAPRLCWNVMPERGLYGRDLIGSRPKAWNIGGLLTFPSRLTPQAVRKPHCQTLRRTAKYGRKPQVLQNYQGVRRMRNR